MTIRLILGDQLNEQHSWYKNVDDAVCYVMFEMRQETDYVKHHIQKVVAFCFHATFCPNITIPWTPSNLPVLGCPRKQARGLRQSNPDFQ